MLEDSLRALKVESDRREDEGVDCELEQSADKP